MEPIPRDGIDLDDVEALGTLSRWFGFRSTRWWQRPAMMCAMLVYVVFRTLLTGYTTVDVMRQYDIRATNTQLMAFVIWMTVAVVNVNVAVPFSFHFAAAFLSRPEFRELRTLRATFETREEVQSLMSWMQLVVRVTSCITLVTLSLAVYVALEEDGNWSTDVYRFVVWVDIAFAPIVLVSFWVFLVMTRVIGHRLERMLRWLQLGLLPTSDAFFDRYKLLYNQTQRCIDLWRPFLLYYIISFGLFFFSSLVWLYAGSAKQFFAAMPAQQQVAVTAAMLVLFLTVTVNTVILLIGSAMITTRHDALCFALVHGRWYSHADRTVLIDSMHELPVTFTVLGLRLTKSRIAKFSVTAVGALVPILLGKLRE